LVALQQQIEALRAWVFAHPGDETLTIDNSDVVAELAKVREAMQGLIDEMESIRKWKYSGGQK
jgi:hypothetical protein